MWSQAGVRESATSHDAGGQCYRIDSVFIICPRCAPIDDASLQLKGTPREQTENGGTVTNHGKNMGARGK